MNLSESLAVLTNKLSRLTEARGHLDHPEDMIFLGGSKGAASAIQSIINTAKNPNSITIKWDGYPALIFGNDSNGKFSIMDKHMFNKKDGSGRVHSPKEFMAYDQARGVNRESLYHIINAIWQGLAKDSHGTKGYYWGDLLFSHRLEEQNGVYSFKANPNGIAYKVSADSPVGKLIAGKDAGVAVHQFLNPNSISTDDAQSLNGGIGNLKNSSNVVVVPSKMPNTSKINISEPLLKNAQDAIAKFGPTVDQFLENAPQARNAFTQLFTVYINKKIVAGDLNNLVDGFMEFLTTRKMSDGMRAKITEYMKQNAQALTGAFTIWAEIYKLKMDVISQLNKAAEASPVKGYLQDGTETHEGFVSNGVKLVDRMGFSRQNLAGR
jgi:hypothetical protein